MIQRTVLRSLQSATRQQQPLRSTSRTPFQPSRLSAVAPASQRLPSQRWYSQEGEAQKQETAEAQADAQGQGDKATSSTESPPKAEDPIAKELEAKKKENIDLTDRLKRQVAEFRNLQDQTKREVQAARDFALQRFAKDLLDSVDNLDRALTTVPPEKLSPETNKDLVDLHSGLKMTEKILLDTLKKHGMERFDPAEAGEKFDPNRMEATFQTPQPGKEDGTAFFTQQKGFVYNGRVLRAAKVGVVKNA
ncbi:mitochondrial co-chaperone GrpE/grpE like protein [Teratosphaeria destructans]|uniref:GrpE protein homolog n=1 Tax=Teratosphaeria destructans TaxID=418781 RepID=A0A9W7W287_9PEZI|nr:mitochondrial co-chaperone GrpE/grpE like protein [Teratosphaeria destructans]